MKLVFDQDITFSAAHYIPNHEKCSAIHGHTYFVKGLTVSVQGDKLNSDGMLIDFGIIKSYFKEHWDHRFIVPMSDHTKWKEILFIPEQVLSLKPVWYTTCEYMAKIIKDELESMLFKATGTQTEVSFLLTEGPGQGVHV